MMGKESDLQESSNIDISKLNTVCLALGPYRNLTTLTASLLFLHPECQVLNHAGERIFGDPETDFIKFQDNDVFDRFCRYAIYISKSGQRGEYGGSIKHSHAFDSVHSMKDIYENTYGECALKDSLKSLFWKESLRTSNYIRQLNLNVSDMFSRYPLLRFLMPVRNPIDCAISNLKTGHVSLFEGFHMGFTIEDTIDALLNEYLWVFDMKSADPDKVFVYFDNKFDSQTLMDMADFMGLGHDNKWVENCLAAFDLKGGYQHPKELVGYYRKAVENKLQKHPKFQEILLSYA